MESKESSRKSKAAIMTHGNEVEVQFDVVIALLQLPMEACDS